jgi:transcriptional regulator with XRE-family HTH domain
METKIYPIMYPNSLRKHRKAAGLCQHEVARALGLSSVERISKWENGHSIPRGRSLLRLAILYRVPAQQLFNEVYQSSPVDEHIPAESEAAKTIMAPYDGEEPGPFWKKGPIRQLIPISASTAETRSEVDIQEAE